MNLNLRTKQNTNSLVTRKVVNKLLLLLLLLLLSLLVKACLYLVPVINLEREHQYLNWFIYWRTCGQADKIQILWLCDIFTNIRINFLFFSEQTIRPGAQGPGEQNWRRNTSTNCVKRTSRRIARNENNNGNCGRISTTPTTRCWSDGNSRNNRITSQTWRSDRQVNLMTGAGAGFPVGGGADPRADDFGKFSKKKKKNCMKMAPQICQCIKNYSQAKTSWIQLEQWQV